MHLIEVSRRRTATSQVCLEDRPPSQERRQKASVSHLSTIYDQFLFFWCFCFHIDKPFPLLLLLFSSRQGDRSCARSRSAFAEKVRIWTNIFSLRLTKIFVAIFALTERLPTSATLLQGSTFQSRAKAQRLN